MTTRDPAEPDANGSEHETVRRFRRTVQAGVAGTALVAVGGVLADAPGMSPLGSIRPSDFAMAPAAAACFLVLSMALLGHERNRRTGEARTTVAALSCLVAVFGLLDIIGERDGLDLTGEGRLTSWMGALGTMPIGRMSPATALGFTIAGTSAFLLVLRSRSARRVSNLGHAVAGLGLLIVLIGATVLLGFAFGTPLLQDGGKFLMEVPTAVAFLFLGSALSAAAGPESFPTRLVVGDSLAVVLARAFLVLTTASLLVQGIVTHRMSHVTNDNDALLASTLIVVTCAITAAVASGVSLRYEARLAETASRRGASKERYRTILQKAMDGFWLVDAEGRLLEVNEAYLRMSGYGARELLTLRIPDVGAIETAEETAARFRNVVARGEDRFESRHRRKDGSTFDVAIGIRHLPDDDGGRFAVFVQDITARRRAEHALQESEFFFRESQRAARIGSYHVDSRAGFWKSSEVLDAILGIDASYVRSVSGWIDLVHPDDAMMMSQYLQDEVFGKEQSFEKEYRIIRRSDGAVRWVRGLGALAFGTDGAVTGLTGTIQDITDRRQAEDALRSSEQEFRSLAEAMPQIAWATRPDGWTIYYNRQWTEYTGLTLDESYGHGWSTPLHPDDRQLAWDAWQRAIRFDERYAVECRLRRFDGEYRWFLNRGEPLRGASGEILKWFGTCTDIHDIKSVEESLRQSELRLRDITTSIGDWVWEVDQHAVYTYSSATGAQWFGDVLGKTAFDFMPAEEAERVRALFADIAAARAPIRDLENWNVTTDGEDICLLTSGVPILGPDGSLKGYRGVDKDITDRKRAEQEQTRLNAQLQQAQKMESVGRLAGGVSHDFNNMLGVILGNVDFALGRVDAVNPLHADLEEIRGATLRSIELTRQLLTFARKQEVSPRVLDLNQTVAGMLRMLQRLIGEDIDLRWMPADGLWSVRIDPSQVDQILANLCVNARDAISGTGTLSIETGHRTFAAADCADRPECVPGDYVMLAVHDDGSGMDAHTMSHLFEPFFTTKLAGKGTGLGLSTVYGIVLQNGGLIEVDSERALGTSLRIYLPRHVGNDEQRHVQEPPSAAARGRETILVVEDEPGVLALVTKVLEGQGYVVLRASTPGEAMRVAATHAGQIDLLLTDVVMPEMNGRDLAERLLALDSHMKRLFMSGYSAEVFARRGVVDDDTHFIPKPFTQVALTTKVRALLDGG